MFQADKILPCVNYQARKLAQYQYRSAIIIHHILYIVTQKFFWTLLPLQCCAV